VQRIVEGDPSAVGVAAQIGPGLAKASRTLSSQSRRPSRNVLPRIARKGVDSSGRLL
jgi:hypothetical protein